MSRKHHLRVIGASAALLLALLGGGLTNAYSAPAPLAPLTPPPAPARPGPGLIQPGPAPAAAPPAAAASAGAAAAAAAQPRVLIIDRNYILQRSSAGRDLLSQMQNLTAQFETQARTEQTQLQNEEGQLQQQLAIMAPDVRDQKEKDFVAKQSAAQQRLQQRQAEIQAGWNKSAHDIELALLPILQGIMKERGANMVLDRTAVIMEGIDVDVTPVAIQRLDQKLPHVKLEPVKVAAGATPAAGAAPAPAPVVAAPAKKP